MIWIRLPIWETPMTEAPTLEDRKVAVEEGKLKMEQDKLAFEKSWRKVLEAGILTATVALGGR
jgi:hypothetical protein